MEAAEVAGIAPEIWETMLGLPLEEAPVSDDELDADRSITGLITIAGDWNGAVTLKCMTAAARRFGATMFGYEDPAEISLEEIRDAHAELTNMAGGGVKNHLEGVPRLGIPTVTEGVGYRVTVPRTKVAFRLTYRSDGDAVVLLVHEAK